VDIRFSRASKDLIKVVLDNGLVKTYMQEQLTGLRISLESGVPTIRNKEGGHGQGNTPELCHHILQVIPFT
jgi:hypothetical protein